MSPTQYWCPLDPLICFPPWAFVFFCFLSFVSQVWWLVAVFAYFGLCSCFIPFLVSFCEHVLLLVMFVYHFGGDAFFESVSWSGCLCASLTFVFHLSLIMPILVTFLLLASCQSGHRIFLLILLSSPFSPCRLLLLGFEWAAIGDFDSYVFAALTTCFFTVTDLLVVSCCYLPLDLFITHSKNVMFYVGTFPLGSSLGTYSNCILSISTAVCLCKRFAKVLPSWVCPASNMDWASRQKVWQGNGWGCRSVL